MIRLLAEIELYKIDNGRKTPFKSGYRPLFNFTDKSKVSGQVILKSKDFFYPGDTGLVEINFLPELLKEEWLVEGKEFTFDEGITTLGEGKLIRIID
jgi:elongation factor Tu